MEKLPAYRFLTAAFLAVLAGASAADAAQCCGSPDAGVVLPLDQSQAAAQEAWTDLYIEKVDTVAYPDGGRRPYWTLHALRKRPVDTSVFFQVGPAVDPSGGWITSLAYDTAGFPETLIDSFWSLPAHAGDTLKDVFVARATYASGRSYLAYGGVQCKPLVPVPGPFPISEALKALGRFRDSLAASQGQPRLPPIRLGPIFKGMGEPELSVRAEAQGDAWLIHYRTGSGDCPAGCIQHEETVYRVSASGKAEVVPSLESTAACSADPVRPSALRSRRAPGASGCYTPDGRMLPGNRPPDAALPWMGRP